MTHKILLILTIILNVFIAQAQEFSTDAQYEQAMKNAKLALSANQYSQAVMFYREALSIKPNELLPKYRIEDIRTIYIKNELDSLTAHEPVVTKKKKKKEIEAETVQLQEKAEEIATAKMYDEAAKEKQELQELVIVADVLEIDDTVVIEDEIDIEDTKLDKDIPLNKVEKKQITQVKNKADNNTKGIIIESRETPAVIETPEEQLKVEVVENKKVIKEPVKKTSSTPIVTKEWIIKENGKLAIKYPNNKTIEEIEKPGKHITRVIMNIDQKVTIYLKVKHSWGATFYFIDEVGYEPSSISAIHFNRMTDLSTYHNE